MGEPRTEVVERLIKAASDGMLTVAHESTANEVFSAYFTMAKYAVMMAIDAGADPQALRDAVQKVYEVIPSEMVH